MAMIKVEALLAVCAQLPGISTEQQASQLKVQGTSGKKMYFTGRTTAEDGKDYVRAEAHLWGFTDQDLEALGPGSGPMKNPPSSGSFIRNSLVYSAESLGEALRLLNAGGVWSKPGQGRKRGTIQVAELDPDAVLLAASK